MSEQLVGAEGYEATTADPASMNEPAGKSTKEEHADGFFPHASNVTLWRACVRVRVCARTRSSIIYIYLDSLIRCSLSSRENRARRADALFLSKVSKGYLLGFDRPFGVRRSLGVRCEAEQTASQCVIFAKGSVSTLCTIEKASPIPVRVRSRFWICLNAPETPLRAPNRTFTYWDSLRTKKGLQRPNFPGVLFAGSRLMLPARTDTMAAFAQSRT